MTNDSLPDAELDVLSCLWKHGDLTARDVREKLAASRPMTHSAVSTLLARLLEKSMVTRRKSGRSFTYRAVQKAQRAGMRVVSDTLERVFGGNPIAVVSSLFQSRRPTADELNQLQDLVDELRTQSEKGAKR
jgi:BlaI family transcriptional regulator, penicillinase repressor